MFYYQVFNSFGDNLIYFSLKFFLRKVESSMLQPTMHNKHSALKQEILQLSWCFNERFLCYMGTHARSNFLDGTYKNANDIF